MTPENVPDELLYAVLPAFYGIPPETWANMTRDNQDEANRLNGRIVRRVIAATINLAENLNSGSEHIP